MNGNFCSLPESVQVACFGAFFAIAEVDHHIHESELELIFRAVERAELSPAAVRDIQLFRVQPPRLSKCLIELAGASREIRIAVLLQLVEVAWADEVLRDEERAALARACRLLAVGEALLRPLLGYVRLKSEGGRVRSLDVARQELEDVGVPVSALTYFDLEGGHKEILDVLLRKLRTQDHASRFRSMVVDLCQAS